jgi:hypothetical protein
MVMFEQIKVIFGSFLLFLSRKFDPVLRFFVKKIQLVSLLQLRSSNSAWSPLAISVNGLSF